MNITLVYFIYGLAFFSLGLLMFFEAGRAPLLAEASVLRPLALFGFVHGAHEWLEMFLDKSDWFIFSHPLGAAWLRIGILGLSFCLLLAFGFSMLRPMRLLEMPARDDATPTPAAPISKRALLLLGAYILIVLSIGLISGLLHADWMTHLDVGLRYALAVPGAAIAGLALRRQAGQAQRQALPDLSRWLAVAGAGFLAYAATQLVAPRVDIFPLNLINTASFMAATGLPIQALRAAAAILIAFAMTRVVQATEAERQRQFLAAQHERLVALEQVQQELLAREVMRQDLLHSIVLAQEDERTRIARELHDETSQTLTAFSLHLAALRTNVDSVLMERIELLQSLARQMAQDIYRLVRDLRPAQLDDLGLPAALNYLVSENRQRLGLDVTVKISGERRRLPPVAETVLFRVAQEALTNVARHSGGKQATLVLAYGADAVTLTVKDSGRGCDLRTKHVQRGLGLAGMRERVRSAGGEFTFNSRPGQGTKIEVVIKQENY